MDDLALGGPLDQCVINRPEEHARSIQDIPLGRSRNRIAQVLLKVFQPVEGHAAAVFQERQHGHSRVVKPLILDPLGQLRREDLAAEIAAQPGALIDGGL